MRRALLVTVVATLVAATEATAAPIRDGNARFEVISPTLIRLEYAADGRFENRPSLTAVGRRLRRVRIRVRRTRRALRISTRHFTLRYLRGSGPFGPGNLRVRLRLDRRRATVRPRFPGPPGPSAGPPSPRPAPTR
jgi:hypothetical protein